MRLTSLAASIALLAACSSKSSQDFSSLQLAPEGSASVPADGQTKITIQIVAYGTDGTTPYNGQVELSCKSDVLFGGQQTAGASDVVTVVNGNATDTVTCAPGANCVGQDTIRGALIGGAASATSSTEVTFTGPGGSTTTTGTVSGTTGTGSSTSGTGSSTSGTGTSTSSTGGTSGTTGQVDAGLQVITNVVGVGVANPYMGVDYGTSYVKSPVNTFTFEVTDSNSKPIAGVPVTFTISTSQPSTIPPFVGTLVGAFDGGVDGESVLQATDSSGQVQAQAHSGQKAGTVTITASVDAGMSILNATESSAVVGTQPSMSRSAMSCGPVNLPVYATGNTSLPCETTSPENYETVCIVNLADRFGQVVQVPVALQFYTEAGNFVQPSVTTPAFGATGTNVVPGQATNVLQTTSNVPIDVAPQSNEPSYTDLDPQNERCGERTYNPRDGLVTVIAVFEGEEAFKDLTGTGIYQPGDPFTDMPQPFVDFDDTSVYNGSIGDICVGATTAGECAGPNGAWDANSNLWVETRILYSGLPGAGIDVQTPSVYVSSASADTDDTTILFDPTTYTVPEMGSVNGGITFADINLNVPAAVAQSSTQTTPSTFSTFNAVISQGPTTMQCTFPAPGSKPAPGDTLGMADTPVTECDAGFVDAGGTIVASQICQLVTHITEFTGGFSTAFKLTNSNSQLSGAGSFAVTATTQAGASSAAATATGYAQ